MTKLNISAYKSSVYPTSQSDRILQARVHKDTRKQNPVSLKTFFIQPFKPLCKACTNLKLLEHKTTNTELVQDK